MSRVISTRNTLVLIAGFFLVIYVALPVIQIVFKDIKFPIWNTTAQNKILFQRLVVKDEQRSQQELSTVTEKKEGNVSMEFLDSYNRKKSGNKERSLPGALIIGVRKGGTRALLEILRMHPNVVAPIPELHFFDKFYDKGLDWYRFQMPYSSASQLTIEKTPEYLITQDGPRKVFSMSSSVLLLLVVRDPVTRALSDHLETASKTPGDRRSFEEKAFRNHSISLVDTEWIGIRLGLYANHLERWTQYFPLSRIHVVSGERLVDDPVQELKAVENFLGIRPVINSSNFVFVKSKGFFCFLSPGKKVKRCLGKSKGRPHPQVASIDLQRLRDFFRPFNKKFYKMVGRDFGWP